MPSKAAGSQALLSFAVFPFQFRHIETSSKKQLEFFQVDRLAEKIVGAATNRLQRILLFLLSRNNDDLDDPVGREKLRQRRQSLAGFIRPGWQTQIQDDDGWAVRR